MDIGFYFQGDPVYTISLPDNTISASFEIKECAEPYDGVKIHIPSIVNINFKEDQ